MTNAPSPKLIKFELLEIIFPLLLQGRRYPLGPLSALAVAGPDAFSFLQAQATQDLKPLQNQTNNQNNNQNVKSNALLTAFTERGGRLRAEAVVLAQESHDQLTPCFWLLTPRHCFAQLWQRLEQFLVSEEVELTDVTAQLPTQLEILWHWGAPPVAGFSLPYWYAGQPCQLIAAGTQESTPLASPVELAALSCFWDIPPDDLSGASTVQQKPLTKTSHALYGLSLTKGCYPGQETLAKLLTRGQSAQFQEWGQEVLLAIELPQNILSSPAPGTEITLRSPLNQEEQTLKVLLSLQTNNLLLLMVNAPAALKLNESQWNIGSSTARLLTLPLAPTHQPWDWVGDLLELVSHRFATNADSQSWSNLLPLLHHALALAPHQEDLYEFLSVLLAQGGKLQEAIALLHQLEALNPKTVMCYTNLSQFYQRLGMIEEAEKYRDRATEKTFELLGQQAKERRQQQVQEQQLLRQREFMFREVLALDPDDEMAHVGLAQLAFDQKTEQGDQVCREHLQHLRSVHPSYVQGYVLAAKLALRCELWSEAQDLLRQGIALATKKGEMKPANEMSALLQISIRSSDQ